MQVFGPSSVHSARPICQNSKASAVQNSPPAARLDTVDQLEISQEAQYLLQAQGAPDIRAQRVAEIRSQIQAGKYESLDKVSVAVDRLLNELV
jgi:negative regulator of flagellin synthesis FlgM